MKQKLPDPAADERLELLFRHAGLSEKQAKLYRLMLALGDARPSTLSGKSGIKRGNTYALLDDLVRRGLATKFDKCKITYYRPEPPVKLINIITAREKEVGLAKTLASDLLPGLTSQYKTIINRPVVHLYEGKEGMQTIFTDIYGKKEQDNEVLGCVDIERVHTEFPEQLQKKLIPMRKKYNWIAKSIFSDNRGGRDLKSRDSTELRESYLIDPEKYPLPSEIDVYDDKITMLSFESGEFMGLVIENPAFARTLKSIFSVAMDTLEKQHSIS